MEVQTKDIKLFALTLTIVTSYISFRLFRAQNINAYYSVLSVSILLFILALNKPAWLTLLYKVLTSAFHFIIKTLTNIILIIVFYLIVTPIGLYLRIIGKDLLNIKDTNQESYWIKKEYNTDKGSYLKQF